MKNLNFISVLALSMLLMLGACKKNDSASSGDPSTPEGKIEMGIAALGTNGNGISQKLSKKGWSQKSSSEFVKGNESCLVYKEDEKVFAVYFMMSTQSFTDAKSTHVENHKSMIKKFNTNYDGFYRNRIGQHEEFNNPDDYIKFFNSTTDTDYKLDAHCSENVINKNLTISLINTFEYGTPENEKSGYTAFIGIIDNTFD